MKRYIFALILMSLLLPALALRQALPIFEGFETGNTHNAPVTGWAQESIAGDGVPWTANNSYTNYNRAPRTGAWNAFLQYHNSQWMYKAVSLQAGIEYRVRLYARQDTNNPANATIAISYGQSASAAGMSHSILAPTGIVNGAYQMLQGYFTPSSSGTFYIGILGETTYVPWYLSIDDITIEAAPTSPQLVYSPGSLNFDNVLYGVNSDPKILTLSNFGGGILHLNAGNFSFLGVNATDFVIDSSVLPQSLNGGASFDLPITALPLSEGDLSATLRIAHGGQNYDIPLVAHCLPADSQNFIIGTGTATSRYPLGSYFSYERSAALYAADELGAGNKRISALAWYATQSSNDIVPTRIYLKSLPTASLVNDTWANLLAGANLVYQATDSPIVADSWKSYMLNSSFDLDAGNSLLVLVERNIGGYGGSAGENAPAIYATQMPGMHLRYQQDYNPPAGMGLSQSLRPNLRLTASPYEITTPPLPARLLAPQNGIDMQPLQLDLEWLSGGAAPTGFRLYFGSENPPPLVADLGMAYSYAPTELEAGNTYYWQIVPYNEYGDALNCPVWSFSTIPVGLAEIGTDTQASEYPFYSLYEAARTQMLFTADELMASGISPFSYIYRLGFDVISANPIVLNNLEIRLKHTDAATLSGFEQDADNFTTCYIDHIALANGWYYFDFSEHFLYSGEQNLLIDISYTNQIWADHSRVYATLMPGKTWAAHAENGIGANLGAGAAWDKRPNLRIFSTPPTPLAPSPPLLSYPANGATELPIEGFYLRWLPDLVDGGIPDYYAIYLSQSEEDIFSDHYYESPATRFDPVQEGGTEFGYNQRWYWAIEAINGEGTALSEIYRFDTISPPPAISVDQNSFNIEIPSGESITESFNISNTGLSPLNYSIRFGGDAEPQRDYRVDTQALKPRLALDSERSPLPQSVLPDASKALYDLQFAFTPSGGGEYGLVYADGYFYTSQWNSEGNYSNFFRYDLQGNPAGSFQIDGAPEIRDLTCDGRYFYATNATTTIYKLDFATATLVSTITAPVNARGISYDADANGLWISNNWGAPLYLVALDGSTMRILDSSLELITGIAYENFGESPTIWANTQNGHLNNTLIQIDVSSGNVLNTYPLTEALFPFLNEYSIAGGIQVAKGIIPGTATILATSQNEVIYGLEYAPAASWASVYPQAGTVAPGASTEIELSLSAAKLNAGTYFGHLTINSNAPDEPLQIPLSLLVSGDWLPEYTLSPGAWDFGEVELLNPNTQSFSIYNAGGNGLLLNPGDIYLAGDTEGNFQIQALQLPQSLNYNQSYRFELSFTPQSLGAKSALLLVQDNLGRTLHSYPLNGTGIEENISQVIGLQGIVKNYNDVLLSWGLSSGEPAEPGWLYYDNGTPYTGVGTGMVGSFSSAIKFDSIQLWDYAGMYLEKLKIVPTSGHTDYTLKLWTGSDASLAPSAEVYSQPLNNLTLNEYNEITLASPYLISQGEALWIGYQCDVNMINEHPAGADSGPALVGKGDLLYVDGAWHSLYEYTDFDYNWCLRAFVNHLESSNTLSPEPIELALSTRVYSREQRPTRFGASGSCGEPTRALKGYNIFRNGTQINSELAASAMYLDENLPDGTYTYSVQAVYYSQLSPLSAPAEISIATPQPLSLPFSESWDSLSFETNYWSPAAANWELSVFGNPAPSVGFFWDPPVENYSLPLTSYQLDATELESVYFSFELSLENYSNFVENKMYWELWDGSAWHTLGSYSSFAGDLEWTTFSHDISEYAANRIFKIRFRAAGIDSFEINAWNIDNIVISDTPTVLDTVSGLQIDIAEGMIELSWNGVAGATSYQIYISDDPYGEFELLEISETTNFSVPFSLLPESKAFFRVKAIHQAK